MIKSMTKFIITGCLFLGAFSGAFADSLTKDLKDEILPLRDQAQLEDALLKDRLDNLVPMLMRREGIDAWVIISRELNEDPILKTMLPATWLSARRRMVLIFLDHGGEKGVERMAAARYSVGGMFKGTWTPEDQPNQWQHVADILAGFDPKKIALNYSDDWAHADGLTYSEQRDFMAHLPDRLKPRIVSAQNLAVGWLETRTAKEMKIYEGVMEIAHGIIAEGFSGKVVTPGHTTTEDLRWWFRQRIRDLGLITWFHTSIEVEHSDRVQGEIDAGRRKADVLYQGDHVHIDFGISYLSLNTDTQQVAYILRDGETDAPAALKAALKGGNDLQDILTSHFKVGRTGNQILKLTRKDGIEQGLGPIIYTHPIGLHGHGAGTGIGMWDKQDGVPGGGDYPMHADTAYSIELSAVMDVTPWRKKPLPMQLEQDAFYDGQRLRYIAGRQTEYHLIKSQKN